MNVDELLIFRTPLGKIKSFFERIFNTDESKRSKAVKINIYNPIYIHLQPEAPSLFPFADLHHNKRLSSSVSPLQGTLLFTQCLSTTTTSLLSLPRLHYKSVNLTLLRTFNN